MMIDESVATWEGGVDFEPGSQLDVALGLVLLCEKIASILKTQRLLTAGTATLDWWVSTRESVSPPHAPMNVAVAELRDRVTAAGADAVPESISVHGRGVVVEADGSENEFTDLVWFSATTLSSQYEVAIHTPSDAWLPLTLRDEDQAPRANLNAPRLEQALTAIDESLGLRLLAAPSKFAEVEGFRMTNLSYGLIKGLIDPE